MLTANPAPIEAEFCECHGATLAHCRPCDCARLCTSSAKNHLHPEINLLVDLLFLAPFATMSRHPPASMRTCRTCGLRRLLETEPCHVFSLGSHGLVDFEEALLSKFPHCK